MLLPTKLLEEVSKLVSTVQSVQHTKVKEHHTCTFLTLQARYIPNRTKPLSWIEKQVFLEFAVGEMGQKPI